MELPEIVFASSDPAISRRTGKLVGEGSLRPLIPRVYTSNMEDEPENIVRRNIWTLISALLPEHLVSHRSALEFGFSPGGNIYLSGANRRVYKWPGVNIRIAEGPGPTEYDLPFYDKLYVSCDERAFLENLSPSRRVDGEKRTLDQEVVESRLLDILRTRGEAALNESRDKARKIASQLGMKKEFVRLNKIISALLSSRPSGNLRSDRARALAMGEPYDSGRVELFSMLVAAIRSRTFEDRPTKTKDRNSYINFAFFEAYFSNFIEGTRFLVEEAERIVFDSEVIPLRSPDTHDIKGTFELCSDRDAMNRIPSDEVEFIEILRRRHSTIMAGRPDKKPGAFKSKVNVAGRSTFVDPPLVNGTLKHGYKLIQSLEDPFARAMYVMFLISEVHPFEDGNGRVARLMMNAELTHSSKTKIIIPTVYRDDYLLGLRSLTRKLDPGTFIRMMDRAHAFSHWLNPTDYAEMKKQLHAANAFLEPDEEGAVLRW